MMKEQPYIVFYDGHSEHLASEMIWFERRDSQEQLRFVDIRTMDRPLPRTDLEGLRGPNCLFAVDPSGALLSGRALIESLLNCVGLGWMCRPGSEPILRQASPLCFCILNDFEEEFRSSNAYAHTHGRNSGRQRLL